MRQWWISGLAALALAVAAPTVARADPPIWRVTDADTEMVLFGSIHALPEGVDWHNDALDKALAEADLVAFEILTPDSDEEEMATYLPMLRYMVGEETLDVAVTPATYARARVRAEEQGIEPMMLDILRPWAAAMILDIGADTAKGRSNDLGVDGVIEGGLRPDQRTVALDTPALLNATMQVMAETGDAEGEQLLVEVLDALDEEKALDMEIENAWVQGDLQPLLAEMESMKAEAPRLYEVILVDRNHGWMPALKQMMETERRVVVVVGAAHMVGEDGLPTLLRQAGYKVEGP
ncbi:MAG: TraB/GumN family protein [Brevundimonas sp.]|nr:TraB/GumN family protein [Brevundimonas sp.]